MKTFDVSICVLAGFVVIALFYIYPKLVLGGKKRSDYACTPDDVRKLGRFKGLFGDFSINKANLWKVLTVEELVKVCCEAFEIMSKMHGLSVDELTLDTAINCEDLAVWAVENARNPRYDPNDLLFITEKPKRVADLLRAMVVKS